MYKIGSWIFGVIGFYSFGNGLWQLANMSYFLAGSMFDLPTLLVKIIGLAFMIICLLIIFNFLPALFLVFLLTLYLNVNIYNDNLYISILLNVWPSITMIFVCLITKSLSLKTERKSTVVE